MIWGCKIYVKKLTSNKLSAKSEKYIIVVYPKKTKRYCFYHPKKQKVFVAYNDMFIKKEFIFKKTNKRKVKLVKVVVPQDTINFIQDDMP